jgi:DNA-binding transcriptional MerR regulator
VNTNELAKKLEISTETLYKYERYFSLKIKRSEDNKRVYEDKDIDIFQNILELKERGLGLAQIKGIVDKTVEVEERKIEVLKNSNFDQFQGKDFELIVTNVLSRNLEGTGKQIGVLQDDVSAGFNGITLRLDTMLKRQDEIIEEKNQKVIEQGEEIQRLNDEVKRLKALKWYQRR